MGQVNRIPNGFLDLLGVLSLGKNPPAFADQIAPVVDLVDFYSAQTLSGHNHVLNHAAVGDNVEVFVPEGETWFLKGVSIQALFTATTFQEQWRFGFQNPPRSSTGGGTFEPNIWVSRLLTVSLTNREVGDAFYLDNPLPLISGTVLKAKILFRDGGAARNTELDWFFYRFET